MYRHTQTHIQQILFTRTIESAPVFLFFFFDKTRKEILILKFRLNCFMMLIMMIYGGGGELLYNETECSIFSKYVLSNNDQSILKIYP